MGIRKRISLNKKFVFASLILAIILTSIITITSFLVYKDMMVKDCEDSIKSYINVAKTIILSDDVNNFLSGENVGESMKYYKKIKNQFVTLQSESEVDFIDVIIPDEDGYTVVVQGTSETDEKNVELGEYKSYDDSSVSEYYMKLMESPGKYDTQLTNGAWGYSVRGSYTIPDSNGKASAVITAYISINDLMSSLNRYIIFVIIMVASIFVAFIFVYLIVLRKQIISPLQLLINSAQKFVSTGYSEDEKLLVTNIDIHTGDEIQDLAEAFNKMTEDIVQYMNELTKATADRQKLDTELHIASLIQESMLPTNGSINNLGGKFDVHAFMRAAKDVGGDFYDFFLIDKEHLCFVIGDVSDKGVPAALFMAMVKATIKDLAIQNFSVEEILNQGNRIICKNNKQNMFVTLYIGILDLKTGNVDFCNAGHSDAILWKKDGTTHRIDSKRCFVLGGIDDYKYKPNSVTIEKGDIIYLYTDGVSEAINPGKEMYTEERIQKFIKSQDERDMKKVCEGIVCDVDKFAETEPQFDDMTMLMVKWEN